MSILFKKEKKIHFQAKESFREGIANCQNSTKWFGKKLDLLIIKLLQKQAYNKIYVFTYLICIKQFFKLIEQHTKYITRHQKWNVKIIHLFIFFSFFYDKQQFLDKYHYIIFFPSVYFPCLLMESYLQQKITYTYIAIIKTIYNSSYTNRKSKNHKNER